jgi:hypothetical protein
MLHVRLGSGSDSDIHNKIHIHTFPLLHVQLQLVHSTLKISSPSDSPRFCGGWVSQGVEMQIEGMTDEPPWYVYMPIGTHTSYRTSTLCILRNVSGNQMPGALESESPFYSKATEYRRNVGLHQIRKLIFNRAR